MIDVDHPHHRLLALRMHHPQALHWLVHLSFLGVFVVAAIDFSLVPLPVPNATDLLLLWLTAGGGNPWFLVPSAVAGSVLGAYTTWHVAHKSGQRMLRRYSSMRLVKHLSSWMKRNPVLAALALPMLPPPIPLTAFVLAAGALGVARRRFFAAFTVSLTLRYALLAWLGVTYGRHFVRLWASAIRRWSPSLLWVLAALLVTSVAVGGWWVWARLRTTARQVSITETPISRIE
ncbi:MAG: VTT domain-containing protein [Acidobacteriaceae bacterium]